jgi:hypothetical protein
MTHVKQNTAINLFPLEQETSLLKFEPQFEEPRAKG